MKANNTPMTKARFNEYLKDFDVNKDGKIDKMDLHHLKNAAQLENGVLNFLRLHPLLALFVPKTGGSQTKAEMLQKLLQQDNDGVIRRDDIGRRKASCGYRNVGQTQSNCAPVQTNSSQNTGDGSLKDSLMDMHRQAGNKIKDLQGRFKNAKTDTDKKKILMDIQEQKDMQAFLIQMRTSMQKRHHDTMMGIARNMA